MKIMSTFFIDNWYFLLIVFLIGCAGGVEKTDEEKETGWSGIYSADQSLDSKHQVFTNSNISYEDCTKNIDDTKNKISNELSRFAVDENDSIVVSKLIVCSETLENSQTFLVDENLPSIKAQFILGVVVQGELNYKLVATVNDRIYTSDDQSLITLQGYEVVNVPLLIPLSSTGSTNFSLSGIDVEFKQKGFEPGGFFHTSRFITAENANIVDHVSNIIYATPTMDPDPYYIRHGIVEAGEVEFDLYAFKSKQVLGLAALSNMGNDVLDMTCGGQKQKLFYIQILDSAGGRIRCQFSENNNLVDLNNNTIFLLIDGVLSDPERVSGFLTRSTDSR